MATWKESKRWADQFVPHIKSILGTLFIVESTIDEDRLENTDLVFEIFDRRFAIRIRNIKERLAYNRRNEWTIRISRPSGIESELTKLMNGWGDFCLYGWGDEETNRIRGWTVFNLNEVRKWLFYYVLEHKKLPGQQQKDRDGSATFVALCIDEMPIETIVRRHTVLPGDPESIGLHHSSPVDGRAHATTRGAL